MILALSWEKIRSDENLIKTNKTKIFNELIKFRFIIQTDHSEFSYSDTFDKFLREFVCTLELNFKIESLLIEIFSWIEVEEDIMNSFLKNCEMKRKESLEIELPSHNVSRKRRYEEAMKDKVFQEDDQDVISEKRMKVADNLLNSSKTMDFTNVTQKIKCNVINSNPELKKLQSTSTSNQAFISRICKANAANKGVSGDFALTPEYRCNNDNYSNSLEITGKDSSNDSNQLNSRLLGNNLFRQNSNSSLTEINKDGGRQLSSLSSNNKSTNLSHCSSYKVTNNLFPTNITVNNIQTNNMRDVHKGRGINARLATNVPLITRGKKLKSLRRRSKKEKHPVIIKEALEKYKDIVNEQTQNTSNSLNDVIMPLKKANESNFYAKDKSSHKEEPQTPTVYPDAQNNEKKDSDTIDQAAAKTSKSRKTICDSYKIQKRNSSVADAISDDCKERTKQASHNHVNSNTSDDEVLVYSTPTKIETGLKSIPEKGNFNARINLMHMFNQFKKQ